MVLSALHGGEFAGIKSIFAFFEKFLEKNASVFKSLKLLAFLPKPALGTGRPNALDAEKALLLQTWD